MGLRIHFLAAVICGMTASPSFAAEQGDAHEKCRVAWNQFIEKNCVGNPTEQSVRKFMAGKYRDVGTARANPEVYRVLFLIDDYHQVEFLFRQNSKLLMTPTVEPKCQWLRFPNGDVVAIPSPEEVALRTKAEKVAIDYVSARVSYRRDMLTAYCRRAEKNRTWSAVVSLDSLTTANVNFLLEVTDDGQVKELRPIEADSKGR